MTYEGGKLGGEEKKLKKIVKVFYGGTKNCVQFSFAEAVSQQRAEEYVIYSK